MEAPKEKRAPPPTWINHEFMESAIRGEGQKKVAVASMEVRYACVEGTGYASLMFRVNLSLKGEGADDTKKESLLVKAALDSGVMKDIVENTHAFRTESLMLYEVIPQIHECLSTVEEDIFRPLAAKCYHYGLQPAEFLVLEDLTSTGFRLADAGHPLDYQHCSLVLQTYARLHAASALLLHKQPHYSEKFAYSAFSDSGAQEYFKSLGSKILCALANELEKCPGYEKYSEKYRSLTERCFEGALDVMENSRNKTKLRVLSHGDCWKNNVMFKYVDGELSEVRLVDFQFSTVCSPAADLQYFLYANASEEVHRHHMDKLLTGYHNTLVDMLRRLGMQTEADHYTLEELQSDMDRSSIMGVFFSAMSGFVLTSEKYGAEFVELFNDPENADEALAKMFRNPYSLSYMKYLTPIFDSKGLLDGSSPE